MAGLRLIKYTKEYFSKWNSFIDASNNGTIFHRLDFLDYHLEKFKENEHHLIYLKGDEIFAVLPLAIFEIEGKKVAKSPYGGSFGGIVTGKATNYSTSSELVSLLIEYLRSEVVDEIVITLPTSILYKNHSDTLFFSFLEKGFKIDNSDISSITPLENKNLETELISSKARNHARKALKSNIITKLNQSIDDFWKVLETTFLKHGSDPTHTYEEWLFLCNEFPGNFWNDVAYLNDKPIAGIGHILINSFTDSSFYLCQDPEFNETQALSLLIFEALINSQKKGLKWFDFGTSSINMVARDNIFCFKENFGSNGIFRHRIKMIL